MFDNLTRFAQIEEDKINPQDQFIRAFYEGRWDEIRETLARLPERSPANVYNKMLGDLAGRNVPVLTLDDFLGLADACPGELDYATGSASSACCCAWPWPKEQEIWLKQALEKGTRSLGSDGRSGLVTGRILMHADFDELARDVPAHAWPRPARSKIARSATRSSSSWRRRRNWRSSSRRGSPICGSSRPTC